MNQNKDRNPIAVVLAYLAVATKQFEQDYYSTFEELSKPAQPRTPKPPDRPRRSTPHPNDSWDEPR